MPWPLISDITASVKGMIAGDEPATTASDIAADATTPDTEPQIGTDAEPKTVEPTTPEPVTAPTADIAALIKEKGAAAFLADLPEEVKETLGPELNKAWYKRLNERDSTAKALEAKIEALPALFQQQLDERFDALITQGMSDEDKQAFTERKELEKFRAEKGKKPEPVDTQRLVAEHPTTAEFWRIVTEAGLPRSTDDERVRKVWQEAWNATSPEEAVATMRTAVARLTKPETKPVDQSAEIVRLAGEMAEKALDAKLRSMGLLSADTGKPGTGGISGKNDNSFDGARKAMEQALKEAIRT